jgi:hypothetical protein
MNLKSLIIATVLSSQAQVMAKDIDPILRSSDFTHAEEIAKQGASIVRLNLTQTGIDKIEQLSKVHVKDKITFEVNGKFFAFKLREPFKGDSIEVGPYSHKAAQKMVDELTG